jgi:hypothetical protein
VYLLLLALQPQLLRLEYRESLRLEERELGQELALALPKVIQEGILTYHGLQTLGS